MVYKMYEGYSVNANIIQIVRVISHSRGKLLIGSGRAFLCALKNTPKSTVSISLFGAERKYSTLETPIGKSRRWNLDLLKFKHLCCMFESFYTLNLRQKDDSPNCERQLGLYSKKTQVFLHIRYI
jgi:hypothetical protein